MILQLRNHGIMKAVLALTSRYICNIDNKTGESADSNTALQYYYETLHYLQNALKQSTAIYANSEELLAIAMIISTYEMLSLSSSGDWNRHLKGIFWLQRSQEIHGASGGLRQAVWWLWLRQDLWAAFRERRKCYSFWVPTKPIEELNTSDLAGFSIYLLSQAVNYCAIDVQRNMSTGREIDRGDLLANMLSKWKSCLGPEYAPLPTAKHGTSSVFQPIWIHPPTVASALQVHSFATILLTLHRPSVVSGFSAYRKTQKILSDAVSTICGIAGMSSCCAHYQCLHKLTEFISEELKAEECQIMSAQCLFGAGLCVEDNSKRDRIVTLIEACEQRTGWPTATLITSLREEWNKVIE